MFKIRILRVSFDLSLIFNELESFRGAISKRAGHEYTLFHNHLNETKLRYRYPLIQYKIINKKASLMCIQDGVEEVQAFFNQGSLGIELNGSQVPLKLEQLRAYMATLNVYNTNFHYSISNWLALNENNYREYRSMKEESERISLLERILIGNILSMAKGLGYMVDRQIGVKILMIRNELTRTYKDTRFQVFHLEFLSNFFIPDYLGLGKNSSIGYGVVRQIRARIQEKENPDPAQTNESNKQL